MENKRLNYKIILYRHVLVDTEIFKSLTTHLLLQDVATGTRYLDGIEKYFRFVFENRIELTPFRLATRVERTRRDVLCVDQPNSDRRTSECIFLVYRDDFELYN